MIYNEKKETGNKYRQEYLDTLNSMIKVKQEEADKKRYDMYLKMRNNPDKYREELKKMFGWPLTDIDDNIPTCKEELVVREGTTDVIRMQFKLPIGITFYGILFKHNDKEKLPLVISQHGGGGTPELCSGLLEDGSSNYNDMTMRVFEKGVNVFAPQLLLWEEKFYPVPYDRKDIDAKLKQLGSSITAVEIYAIMKSIDYLETCDFVDKDKIGMIGLSYGGFYTLCTTAIDTRIKSSLACSQYNNRYEYSWVDWTWFDAGNKFLDNEIASLVYPRYICIPVGDNDAAFSYELAEKEYNKLREMTCNGDWLDFVKFEGIHEFIKDDYHIEKFLKRLEG